jgi:hypothetical protein
LSIDPSIWDSIDSRRHTINKLHKRWPIKGTKEPGFVCMPYQLALNTNMKTTPQTEMNFSLSPNLLSSPIDPRKIGIPKKILNHQSQSPKGRCI